MRENRTQAAEQPIGVVAALVQGFDRVAAHPVLVLPPLVLDLFLWLGPKVSIAPLIEALLERFRPLPAMDAALEQQVEAVQQAFQLAGERFNLLSALSSLPTGIPSMGSSPSLAGSPLGQTTTLQLGDFSLVVVGWLALTFVGLGMGAFYHVGLARATAPDADLPSGLWAWGRMLLLAVLLYGGLLLSTTVAFMVASLSALVLPLLGLGVSFVAFSLLFWLLFYLVFTPHGIVRYRFGVVRAMMESALLVRWNFMSTFFFLLAALAISWGTNFVWSLPEQGSWFTGLSILGHAFISGMLLAGSYAFYQGRREWLVAARERIEARLEALERRKRFERDDMEEGD